MRQVTFEYLNTTASEIRSFLDLHAIAALEDFTRFAGLPLPLEHREPDHILITCFPQPVWSKAQYQLEFVSQDKYGTVIDIRVHPHKKQTNIFCKAPQLITHYTPFIHDPFKNLVQIRELSTFNLEGITKELAYLASYKPH